MTTRTCSAPCGRRSRSTAGPGRPGFSLRRCRSEALLLVVLSAGWHATSVARPVESGERGKVPSAVRWRVAFSARGLQPAVATLDDAVLVSTGEGLSIFDRQTGRRLGQFKNGSPDLL